MRPHRSAALAAAALALTLAVPTTGAVAAPAGKPAGKPALHFLTTQEFPGPPAFYAWGGAKPKKLKPVGCWEPALKGTPTSYRLFESNPAAAESADRVPGGGGEDAKPKKAAKAFGVQYIAVTKNAAAAEDLVIAIKERLKECARTEVGTPKRPRSAEFVAYGKQKVGDELLIRGIHHKFTVLKKKRPERRQAVDLFGIGRDGRLVTVVSLTSIREDWGRSGWSPAKVVKSFVPTAKAGVDKLR